MDLTLEFSNPYARSQLSGLSSLTLPAGAIVTARTVPRTTALADVVSADTDEIATVTITGFTTMAELTAFLNSAPAGLHDRLSKMSYA